MALQPSPYLRLFIVPLPVSSAFWPLLPVFNFAVIPYQNAILILLILSLPKSIPLSLTVPRPQFGFPNRSQPGRTDHRISKPRDRVAQLYPRVTGTHISYHDDLHGLQRDDTFPSHQIWSLEQPNFSKFALSCPLPTFGSLHVEAV